MGVVGWNGGRWVVQGRCNYNVKYINIQDIEILKQLKLLKDNDKFNVNLLTSSLPPSSSPNSSIMKVK